MPNPAYACIPKIIQFQIGRSFTSTVTPGPPFDLDSGVASQLIGIVKRDDLPRTRVVFGLVENFGDVAFTVEIDESANNNLANNPFTGGGAADAYADRAIRVDAAAVAGGTITVQPGGKVTFIIEMLATSDRYLRFQASAASPDQGRLTLAHFDGTLDRRERESVP